MLCKECNSRPRRKREKYKGKQYYGQYCDTCHNKKYFNSSDPHKKYRKYLKKSCEHCSFAPEHTSQLDIDHIDGNHQNNCPTNLQTLCANCHRLKTYQKKDYLRR